MPLLTNYFLIVTGPREQLNAATHSLDLSNVYGYTYADALKGRTLEKGKN